MWLSRVAFPSERLAGRPPFYHARATLSLDSVAATVALAPFVMT
jgi:hypothetical protein